MVRKSLTLGEFGCRIHRNSMYSTPALLKIQPFNYACCVSLYMYTVYINFIHTYVQRETDKQMDKDRQGLILLRLTLKSLCRQR